MKKIILANLILLVIASASFAVPNLQLYIPDATYDFETETWVTNESVFEVWVIAANLNKGAIYDINLVAALAQDQDPIDGALQITPEGGSTTTYNAADYSSGTPPESCPMPEHGIYPTNYVEMHVADVTTAGPYVPVQDYIPGGDGGTSLYGQIFRYTVSTAYQFTHFDAYGFYEDEDGKRIFAPFSHDGSSVVPEPTTILLFGFGLGMAAISRRRKK